VSAVKEQLYPIAQDRTTAYRTWRREEAPGALLVCDIDQVEYCIRNGEAVPCALLEVTGRSPDNAPWGDGFLASVWKRLDPDGGGAPGNTCWMQTQLLRKTALALKVPAYIVCFDHDMKRLAVRQVAPASSSRWHTCSPATYQRWLDSLRLGK